MREEELVCIKLDQLDLHQNLLYIRQGKGKKDRVSILSSKRVVYLKQYLSHRKSSSNYLFDRGNSYITARTVQQILKQACPKARIQKKMTPHILRHSFTTHLMEQGVKTEYIQQLLGHKDIRTTRAYGQILTKHLAGITSPHDLL